MPASVRTSTAGDALTVLTPTDASYGKINTSTTLDLRVVRFLPAQVAQSVWEAGNTLNTTYQTAVTSYTAAKLAWNSYVDILEKNNKMDAFAAAFSPPKAPTVPPLPALPWAPDTYSGYYWQSPK